MGNYDETTLADLFVSNVGGREKVIPWIPNYLLYPELNQIRPVYSSAAAIVYNNASESSFAGPNVVLPPRYEDL